MVGETGERTMKKTRICCQQCKSTNLRMFKIDRGFFLECKDCNWSWGIVTDSWSKHTDV